MNLNKEVFNLVLNHGITYFGVADLSAVSKSVVDQGNTGISKYPYSISLGITLLKEIVDKLPFRSERSVALNYKLHAYDIINHRLDLIASIISTFIQNKGYKVLPIPAAERINDEKICAEFSHKLGANLSGLGWIGKSCLIITPNDGPRVRWTSILTDAPLKPTGNRVDQQCGDCTECVDICPVKAFTGKLFYENEPREVRYNARKCEKYFNEMKSNSETQVCGMCLYVCPYGKKMG